MNMRQAMVVGIAITLASVPAKAQDRAIRGTTWGMSQAQVIHVEGREPDTKGKSRGLETLAYETAVAEMPAVMMYAFAEGKLVRATYMFTDTFAGPQGYNAQFEKMYELLQGKYGEPEQHVVLPGENKSIYPDQDPIAAGELSRVATWSNDGSKIALVLSGNGDSINVMLSYTSLSLADLEKRAQAKADAEAF